MLWYISGVISPCLFQKQERIFLWQSLWDPGRGLGGKTHESMEPSCDWVSLKFNSQSYPHVFSNNSSTTVYVFLTLPLVPMKFSTHEFQLWWQWKLLSCVQLFASPQTIQSMEFSRPEYWSGYPFPSPRDLPDSGIESGSPVLQADSFPAELPGKPLCCLYLYLILATVVCHVISFLCCV